MSETLNAVTRFAFQELKAKRVDGACNPKNIRSKKMIEGLGFKFEKPIMLREEEFILYARFNTDGLPQLSVKW